MLLAARHWYWLNVVPRVCSGPEAVGSFPPSSFARSWFWIAT